MVTVTTSVLESTYTSLSLFRRSAVGSVDAGVAMAAASFTAVRV